MTEFRMPSLGADMTEGRLLEWLVAPGDQVHRGDVVAVVDTEKAEMDVESFDDGVVERLLVEPGTVVPVGGPLALLGGTGRAPAVEPAPAVGPAPAAEPAPAGVPHPVPAAPPVRRLADRLGVDLSRLVGSGPQGRVTHRDVEVAASAAAPAAPTSRAPGRARVTPFARRVAEELGVDPDRLRGSGSDGAVVARDVRAAAAGTAGTPAPEEVRPPAAPPPAPPPAEPVAARGAAERAASMRHALGVLMARSKREVPHYYLSTTIDLSAATRLLAVRNAERPVGSRLVHAALLLKAAALAARKVPQLNGFWEGDRFVAAEHVNLGVAVNLRCGGLVAPAVADADTLDVDTLMAALRDVVARARSGRMRRSEMTDGTLTVTNLGDRGVEAVFGVIYPPQVALVGLGRVVERPVAVDGLLGVRPVVTATLSADHRATDGHVGGLFLSAMDALLQKPEDL